MKEFVAKIAPFDARACLRKGALCCYTIFFGVILGEILSALRNVLRFPPFFVDACGVYVCVCVYLCMCVYVCTCVYVCCALCVVCCVLCVVCCVLCVVCVLCVCEREDAANDHAYMQVTHVQPKP